MSIVDIIEDIIYNCSDDLNICGKKLIDFTDIALQQRNKSDIIKYFYKCLRDYVAPYYASSILFDDEDRGYNIYEGKMATLLYLILNFPKQQTPVKSLKEIRNLGEYMLRKYIKPSGIQIRKESIKEIMSYLDENYDFSNKVFKDNVAMILLLDNSHIDYNSECYIGKSKDGMIIIHLFLYHMKPDNPENPTPEGVFFHELGHALNARLTGESTVVPPKILDFLEALCFPTIKSLTEDKQCEVFADVISMGMMYKSPFAKYDHFPQILESDKRYFNMLFKKLIENL